MLLMGLLVCWTHDEEKHLWAWGSIKRSFQNGTQRGKKKYTAINEIEYPRTVEQIQMHYIHIMRKPGEGRGKGKEGKFEAIMKENFHKLILDTRL